MEKKPKYFFFDFCLFVLAPFGIFISVGTAAGGSRSGIPDSNFNGPPLEAGGSGIDRFLHCQLDGSMWRIWILHCQPGVAICHNAFYGPRFAPAAISPPTATIPLLDASFAARSDSVAFDGQRWNSPNVRSSVSGRWQVVQTEPDRSIPNLGSLSHQ